MRRALEKSVLREGMCRAQLWEAGSDPTITNTRPTSWRNANSFMEENQGGETPTK